MAERRQWLDFPDRSWKGITGTRRSSQKRTIPMVALDVSVVRRVSTSKQTGNEDDLVHQPSTGVSQQGTVAQYHGGNDAPEHTNETVFSTELSTSVVHAEVAWCVLTSLQRTPVEQRHSTLDCVRCNSALVSRYTSHCWRTASQRWWSPVHRGAELVVFHVSENAARYVPECCETGSDGGSDVGTHR